MNGVQSVCSLHFVLSNYKEHIEFAMLIKIKNPYNLDLVDYVE